MDYENPLDHLIHRFQHRWETNAQFRAAMSGVLGLSLIIFLCVGVAGVNAAATRVLGAVGFGSGGGNQGNLDPGGQIVNGNWTFYTPTVPNWTGGGTPGSSPIANSQTPQPSPTPTATPPDAPTATPCRSNCGGGGGGGVTITAACVPQPCQWHQGQPGTLTFHTSKPNNPINMFIHWSNGATWLSAGGQYGSPQTTDGNGDATWNVPVPAPPLCATTPPVRVDYSTRSGGGSAYGPTLTIPCS
jgi:hypothetical protein